jgi:hypothetical protein
MGNLLSKQSLWVVLQKAKMQAKQQCVKDALAAPFASLKLGMTLWIPLLQLVQDNLDLRMNAIAYKILVLSGKGGCTHPQFAANASKMTIYYRGGQIKCSFSNRNRIEPQGEKGRTVGCGYLRT